jgi:adenylyl-sulfate kinase
LTLFQPLFVDEYRNNRATGSFILIDPASRATVGAGMIISRHIAGARREEPASRNIALEVGQVSAADRAALLGQEPVTIWLTGLSGSGKSTLAKALERRLVDLGRPCYVLDGDNLRHGLNRDLGFSPEDRGENIRRVAEVARLMNEAGIIVIAAFISPYREDRESARRVVGGDRFVEVHLSADLATCEGRDPKGLYRKARAGELPGFTGIGAPYEIPETPDLVLDTGRLTIEEGLARLLDAATWQLGAPRGATPSRPR